MRQAQTLERDFRDELAACDLERLVKSLTRHAICRMRRYRWRGEMNGAVPGAQTPEDFAFEAIKAALAGERTWNPDRYDDPLEFLKDVVSSKIHHAFASGENQGTVRAETWTDSPIGAEARDLLIELDSRLKEDEDLRRLLHALAEGYVKPAEYAAKLGIDVNDATNRFRRFRRWLQNHGYTEEVLRTR